MSNNEPYNYHADSTTDHDMLGTQLMTLMPKLIALSREHGFHVAFSVGPDTTTMSQEERERTIFINSPLMQTYIDTQPVMPIENKGTIHE